MCEVRDHDEARVRAYALKRMIDRGKRYAAPLLCRVSTLAFLLAILYSTLAYIRYMYNTVWCGVSCSSDMNYLVAHYKHVEKETAFLERWCERNNLGDVVQEQIRLIRASIGRDRPAPPPPDASLSPSAEPLKRPFAQCSTSVARETPTLRAATSAARENVNTGAGANNRRQSRPDARQKSKSSGKKAKGVQSNKFGGASAANKEESTGSSTPKAATSNRSPTATDPNGARNVLSPSAPQTTLIPCDAVSYGCLVAAPDDLQPDIVGIAPGNTADSLYVADMQNAQVKLLDLKNRGVSVVCTVQYFP